VMAFLQTQKRHEDDCWEWETCLPVKKRRKKVRLDCAIRRPGDVGSGLTKDFPQCFFFFFFDIKISTL
jgi:hypothetical protein